MARRFEDKVVWITGGGSGLGRALAVEFARQGAHVAVSGRRIEKLASSVEAITQLDRRGLAVPCDVTDENSIIAAVAEVTETYGRLDVVIANAGFSVSGRALKHTPEDWRRQFDTNVIGAVMTVKHSIEALQETSGRAVLIASVASMAVYPTGGAYTASKFALRAIGLTLNLELHGTGISCTLLHPGFVESEIAQVDNQGVYDASRPDPRPSQLMWTSERAARVMVKAIYRRKREYVFTWHGKIATWLAQHCPYPLYFLMRQGLGRKNFEALSRSRN